MSCSAHVWVVTPGGIQRCINCGVILAKGSEPPPHSHKWTDLGAGTLFCTCGATRRWGEPAAKLPPTLVGCSELSPHEHAWGDLGSGALVCKCGALKAVMRPAAEPLPAPSGSKHDQGKRPWHLVPWKALGRMVDVLEHGRKKYGAWNWRDVPNVRERYFAAAQRHLTAWWTGEHDDPESGLPHLAHAMCCVIFLLAYDECDTGPQDV